MPRALIFDASKIVLEVTIDKKTGAVELNTSEDVAYPLLVDSLSTLLQTTTRQFMRMSAGAAPHPFVAGLAGDVLTCGACGKPMQDAIHTSNSIPMLGRPGPRKPA
jgi:hypothetical protein